MGVSPVLVTGGTGFLGAALVERLLDDGRKVTLLGRTRAPEFERRGATFIQASIDDAPAVNAACAGMETVYHIAAKVGVFGRYEDFFRTNVMGTRAIIQGCQAQGVPRLVHTSTPSVVYNGADHAGANESLPLTRRCPSPYPLTKAIAEQEVLAANGPTLRTIALRPHLIWGGGDPHLVPRLLSRARAGKLRIIGDGLNRVDMVHVTNAVDAHLLAEAALASGPGSAGLMRQARAADGRAFFITNGEPVRLWEWINSLLAAVGVPAVRKRMSLRTATALGLICEGAWRALPLRGEPPLTRFIAAELAKDHWFDISAARRDLGYAPRVSMAAGMAGLVAALRAPAGMSGVAR